MNLNIDSFTEVFLGDGAFIPTVADAVVGPSPIAGRGLFSSRARKAGELLAELDGQLVEWERFPEVLETLEGNAVTPELLLVRPLRTSYGLINHSSDPNVVIDPDGRQMRCGRAVELGEEFTMDYFAQPVPKAYLNLREARVLRGER